MKKKAYQAPTLISISVSMEHCLAESPSPSTSVYNEYADDQMERLSDQRDYSEEIWDE